MAIYKTTSSQVIIRKIFRDLKPETDNWVDDAVEWIGEALEHIGASTQLIQKNCTLDITNHKASLPSNLYYIEQVAVNNLVASGTSQALDELFAEVKVLKQAILDATALGQDYTNTVNKLNEINARIVVLENSYFSVPQNLMPLQYGASTFHASMHSEACPNIYAQTEDTYIIDGGYLKTSFQTGTICLSYKAFPIDADGFPMIPDDISYREAMFWYIYKKLLLGNPQFKINNINYGYADEKWAYYCTQARNAANYPDIDRYESFMNQWVRLIPNMNRHDNGFENLNSREDLYRG